MAYWLIKSEPGTYSWDQLVADKKTVWDGIRNFAARNHLKCMKKGDEAFFYHSNDGTEIVGIAKVSKEFFQDPTTEDANWVSVEFKPGKKLKRPVSLASIKANKNLADMVLIKNSRLSVQPVTESQWEIIIQMSEEK